jgi:hypothetical protein
MPLQVSLTFLRFIVQTFSGLVGRCEQRSARRDSYSTCVNSVSFSFDDPRSAALTNPPLPSYLNHIPLAARQAPGIFDNSDLAAQ